MWAEAARLVPVAVQARMEERERVEETVRALRAVAVEGGGGRYEGGRREKKREGEEESGE